MPSETDVETSEELALCQNVANRTTRRARAQGRDVPAGNGGKWRREEACMQGAHIASIA